MINFNDPLAGKMCVYICFFILFTFQAHAQVSTGSVIINDFPTLSEIQTYSRYDSPTDNFPEDYFFVCIGDQNTTVHMRFVAQDDNSYLEISNLGNLSYKVTSVVGGSEFNISSFGNVSKSPMFETNIGVAELSYIDNITLSNTSAYRITANVTDQYNASDQRTHNFSVNNTNCYKVDQNVNLLANQTHVISVNFTEISIVVNNSVSGRIVITEYDSSPIPYEPANPLPKFVTVDIVGPIKNLTANFTLQMNYTDNEVWNNGLNENTLELYNWNGSEWLSTASTIDTSSNTVTFLVQGTKNGISDVRLGTFSIAGDLAQQNNGGGGGGGSNFEPEEEVEEEVTEETEEAEESDDSEEESSEETDTSTDDGEGDGGEGSSGATPGSQSGSAPGDPNRNTLNSSELEVETQQPTRPMFGSTYSEFVSGMLSHKLCIIIIIFLLLLWLITLFLLIAERRKNDEEKKKRNKKKT